MEVRPLPSWPGAVRSSISPPLRHVLSVFFLPFRTVQMRTNVPHRHIYTYIQYIIYILGSSSISIPPSSLPHLHTHST
ncbi:hypothetical protein HanPSC8_Chr04g0184261 [Helianthus annuus]|nr:hypothetical protein HanPSC8_Chr04g0184261 [Helianthus annuus]